MKIKRGLRQNHRLTTPKTEPIAVVGIGSRFPGSCDTEHFWTLLRDGVDAITEVPVDRFDVDAFYDPTPGVPGKLSARFGGFIDGVDLFDADFFGISRREASQMDPQQRLALEVAWEALDDGGQAPLTLKGSSTGVFLGVHRDEYARLANQDASEVDLLSATGNSRSGIAGRISYVLGLQGPSVVFDTDRSSSLVAVHFACQSLRSGECEFALAGGVNLVLSPELSLGFSRAGMLASDGRIKFCDAAADGIVRSDGVGMVVLKTLRAAKRDGDAIYAVILGSATNHDGGRSGDLMTPSSDSQSALLRAACKSAQISPQQIQYVEAHGTGTVVGDPVEVEALASVLQRGREGSALRIGSVKTNIGHTESAGGIAGLIKVALAMKHRLLPASLHFHTANPRIEFGGIVVQSQTTAWPDEGKPLLAGVTSLGLTGLNVHVILGEAPAHPPAAPAADREEVVTVSARDADSLVTLAKSYARALREDVKHTAADWAWSTSTRRSHLEQRHAVVGHTRQDLARELEAFAASGAVTGLRAGRRAKVAFVFPGHGSQWVGMGRELLATEPVFHESMSRCDRSVQKIAGWSLLQELARDAETSRLDQFGIVQPILVAFEISLAALWAHWGIQPDVIVGTSMGEIAAAHIAGVLSLKDAMLVICKRAALVQERVGGKAAIVEMDADSAAALLEGRQRVWIAGRNGPNATLLAGDADELAEVMAEVEKQGRSARLVKDLLATHTPRVDPICAELSEALAEVRPSTASIAMLSTVTGQPVDGGELDGAYWVRNLREPFALSAVVEKLVHSGVDIFLEVSPHPVVMGPIMDVLAQENAQALALGSLRRNAPERQTLLRSLASLYGAGCDVEWESLFAQPANSTPLPTYAWQHQRYWFETSPTTSTTTTSAVKRPALAVPTRAQAQLPAVAQAQPALLAGATPRERRERLLDYVKGEVCQVLGADSVDVKRSFREIGVKSIMTVELASRLGRALGRALPSSMFFNYPNVTALAEYLSIETDKSVQQTQPLAERARESDLRLAHKEPIAVIGMNCRFPGANSPEAFWELLSRGIDAITEVPAQRWAIDGWYDAEPGQPGKMRSRWGGFVDDIDQFDSHFFGISPREAEEMDPQQRLLLEVAWEAMERAGQGPEQLMGSKTGVFVGMMNNNDYVSRKRLQEDPTRIRAHHSTGIATSIAAGRLAYMLGLVGPAMIIDTACSSSLVAVHLAMQSLRRGECRMALAGGVNAILSPELTVAYSQAGMLSPVGRCKTFDASADGYVRSEGCGLLVLQKLSDALADGHTVLAVLKGAGVNHDGRSSGLTAPNGLAQRQVVLQALADASVSPAEVDYVEAHGTGTPLGDPIEFQALGEVFQERSNDNPVFVGSAKTNIGHLEAAAGVAGLMKVILSLQHRQIPPHLHLKQLNPQLSAEKLPLGIPTELTPWLARGRRIAGVSSFGFSGTNAHIILEEAPAAPSAEPSSTTPQLLTLSAKNEDALRAQAQRLAKHLGEHPELSFKDVAFTLATGRTHHDERLVLVGTRDKLIAALDDAAQGQPVGSRANSASGVAKVAWMFPGQGAQRVGMGQQLAAQWPAFSHALNDACAALDAHLPRPLKEVMWAEAGTPEAALLDQTAYTQPALFAVGVALTALWRSFGAEPDLLAGHSIGEIAAAQVAGVFSLADAAKLVVARARLMQALPPGGAMVSIAALEADVTAALLPQAGSVSIAAVNGPTSVVISGAEAAVLAVAQGFSDRGVRTRRLVVSHAFHSALMNPMLEEFRGIANQITYQQPAIKGAANISGALWGPEVATADYWVRHVREAVRFADGVKTLHEAGVRTFIEMGPRATLMGLVPECLPQASNLLLLASLRAERNESEALLEALGAWHVNGGAVDWRGVFVGQKRSVELPTYAWQKQQHWIAPRALARRDLGEHGLLGVRVVVAGGTTVVYSNQLSVADNPWLGDHRIASQAVVPAALLMELLRAAAQDTMGEAPELRSITVSAPLSLPEPRGRRVQVVVTRLAEGRWQAGVHSQPVDANNDEPWIQHAAAEVQRETNAITAVVDLEAVRARCSSPVQVEATYVALEAVGLSYGPAFRGLREVARGMNEAWAHIVVPLASEAAHTDNRFGVHPALLDAALQATVAGGEGLYLPFAAEKVSVYSQGATEAWVHIRYTTPVGQETLNADITLTDAQGQVLVALSGFLAKRADLRLLLLGDAGEADSVFEVQWRVDRRVRLTAPLPLPAGRWAVVAAKDDALAVGLAQRLNAAGSPCVNVDWSTLSDAPDVEHVVCLCSPDANEEAPEAALRCVTHGLALVKALATRTPAPRVWWITRGAMSIDPKEVPDVAAHTLWGFGRTLVQEHPEFDGTLVDLPRQGTLDAALSELALRDSEREVAWRDGQRYTARLERAPAVEMPGRELRTDGTVLVTGGLGGLGRHVARWLAQLGVAHLVLTGRGGDQTTPPSQRAAGEAEFVAELQSLGAEVTVARFDIAARASVAAMLASIPEKYPLRAVFHAAGVVDDGLLFEQSSDRVARVMGPKAAGAWNLDVLTRDLDLDLFVLFSSVVATMGSPAQAPYGAANAFLDGLALRRRAQGLTALSVAWGPWAEVGMAAGLEAAQKQRWDRRGFVSIAPARGLRLLESALTRSEAHLVLAPLDLKKASTYFADAIPPLWRVLVRAAPFRGKPASGWAADVKALPPGRRMGALLEVVRISIAQVLSLSGSEAVGPDRLLNDQGLDSLMAMELRNVLGQRVGTNLPMTLAFDYPTPTAIAKFLIDKIFPAVAVAAVVAANANVVADEPIAVLGFGCRYPGGVINADSFWHLLSHEIDAISEIPKERWDVDAYFDADPGAAGKAYTRSGGFVPGIEKFDPDFFEISRREAVTMDPQQRLLLETSWEALERAGIAPDSLMGANVGVFIGVMSHDYLELQGHDLKRRDGYVTTGSLGSVASGRISYALGVRGPSITIDTACSSSLVATHLACQALRAGECDLALAGGATVVLTPSLYVEFSRLRGLSKDGRCKSFDAAADGVSWSEGCGVIALKRLSDAQRDGDRILGVIRGSAINQDGRSQGLTAPNGPAQQEVIQRALTQAKVKPADVDYIEAHGTGTKLGDPIEMQALGAVLQTGRDAANPVVVGSLKSNIGHSQAAAGVGGIIKTLLAMEHELIPRSLHFHNPSPHIPWSELPVRVAAEALPWIRKPGKARIAGISSFGISGTNAHVIIEEAPVDPRTAPPARSSELLVVSAKTAAGLDQAALELGAFLQAHPELNLSEAATTLARGRSHRSHRLAFVAASRSDASAALKAAADGQTPTQGARGVVAANGAGRLAWLFTGQGAQWRGMGRGLAAEWPVFQQELDKVIGALDAHVERPLKEIMWGDESSAGLLDQTAYTQPALFALEVALAALWRSWGVHPDILVGHSIGELAAAHVAGVFSLADAARLVTARARLMQALPAGGAMAAIAAPAYEVEAAVNAHAAFVSIAAVNAPDSVVISGVEAKVDEIAASFALRGVRTKRLVVSHAFHSPLMDPMLEEFRAVAESVTYQAPNTPLISNLSGALAGAEVQSAEYWVQHVRGAVLFADGVKAARAAGARVFVELGPKPTLLGLLPACLPGDDGLLLLASMRSGRAESAVALEALGAFYAQGGDVDWSGVFARQRPVELPTYAWQRQTYWVDHHGWTGDVVAGSVASARYPQLGAVVARPDGEEHYFATELSLAATPWLAEHKVFEAVLFPGTGLLDLALAAGRTLGLGVVSELTLAAPLTLADKADAGVPVQIWVQAPDDDGRRSLSVYSWTAPAGTQGEWTCHAKGQLSNDSVVDAASEGLGQWPPVGAQAVDLTGMYARLSAAGLDYGAAFQGLKELWRRGDEVYSVVELPAEAGGDDVDSYGIHPALFDAALHALPFLLPDAAGGVLLPFEWRQVKIGVTGATRLRVKMKLKDQGDGLSKVGIQAWDNSGQLVLQVFELVVKRATAEKLQAATRRQDLFQVRWESVVAVKDAAPKVRTMVVGGSGALARRLGVLHLASLTAVQTLADQELPTRLLVDASERGEGDLLLQAHHNTHAMLSLLQQWLKDPRLGHSEVVFFTAGAVASSNDDAVDGLGQAALWGLVRSARSENPHRSLRLLDIEASSSVSQIEEALSVPDEPELVLRSGGARAPRLELAQASSPALLSTAKAGEGTVLVTGGTGELGALVARHLVKQGVRHLLLTSRSGPEASGARELQSELQQQGARVTLMACDSGNRAAVAALLQSVPADAPLKAVFHCAGVVDDGALPSLNVERIDRVFSAKVDAALHLHELTRSMALDAFVLFSSVSGIVGSAGQANYAAANTLLDALAAHRRSCGLPGLSLAWGLWQPSGKGMTAQLNAADLARLRRQGIAPLPVERGLQLLDEAMARTDALLVPARLDMAGFAKDDGVPAMLRKLVAAPAHAARKREGEGVALKKRLAGLGPAGQLAALMDLVRNEVAAVFRVSSQAVVDDQALKSLGLDSLMAVELRDRLGKRVSLSLPTTLAFDYPTPGELGRFVAKLLLKTDDVAAAPMLIGVEQSAEDALQVSQIDGMSNEELAALVKML